MSGIRQRILAALGANVLGQAVNVAIQLLSLPIFLSHWDTATYGSWLMLSALPTYLGMADVGMVTAAGNRMTIEMGRQRLTAANAQFQSAFLFVTVVAAVVAALCVPIALFAQIPGLTTMDRRVALLALVGVVVLGLFGGLAEAMFRSTRRYAVSINIGTTTRLAEWLGSIAGLLIDGSFAAVAVCTLLVRVVSIAICIWIANKGSEGLQWSFRHARWAEIRANLRPAASFMIFPLANGLSLQGTTLLVGHVFGPAAVAMFNTYRTLARSAVQLTGMLSHSLWPEFSRLFGEGGPLAVRRLYRQAMPWSVAASMTSSALLFLLAPALLRLWTHGAIEFSPVLMLLMLGYAAAGGILHVPRILLMATNQHEQLAAWTLLSAVVALALTALLSSGLGLNAAGAAMLISETAIALVSLALAQRLLSRSQAMNAL